MTRALPVLVVLSLAGCGGSGGGNPMAPPVATTEAYGGSIAPSTLGCNSGSHVFTAREGTISVRLDASNAAGQVVSAQICAGADSPGQCTIAQQRLNVGQTLSGERIGGASQTLKLLRQDCVSGTGQGSTPVTYSVTLSYLK